MLALVGKAMSTTHDYQATNDFYEKIIQQNPSNTDINLDYASLLVKNNHFDVSPAISNRSSAPKVSWI